MGICDDQIHAGQAAPRQGAQEVQPQGFRFRTADRRALHLALRGGIEADRDGLHDGDDVPGLSDVHLGSGRFTRREVV